MQEHWDVKQRVTLRCNCDWPSRSYQWQGKLKIVSRSLSYAAEQNLSQRTQSYDLHCSCCTTVICPKSLSPEYVVFFRPYDLPERCKQWTRPVPTTAGSRRRHKMGGDVAQLVEHRTDTPLTQVRFPGAARDFFLPELTFSANSLTLSIHPPVQPHALTSLRTLKIL